MNDSPLRLFCESSHRKLIVAIVTTLAGLVVLLPLTDEYFDKRESRSTLAEELDRARETERTLPEFEKQVAALIEEVSKLEARTVSGSSLSQYRTRLLKVVRESGCQLRSLEPGEPTYRPWLSEDQPLVTPAVGGKSMNTTPFRLERRSIDLLVDGEITNIHRLLEELETDDVVTYPQRLRLNAAPGRGTKATLEMKLWLFALTR